MNSKLGFCARGPSWRELATDYEALETARESRCLGYANGCGCTACEKRSEEFAVRFDATPWEKTELHRLGQAGYEYAGVDDDDLHCTVHPRLGKVRVETADHRAARLIQEHAREIGAPCDEGRAYQLLNRHGNFMAAIDVLDREAA